MLRLADDDGFNTWLGNAVMDVVIVDGVRTAIGSFGGALKDHAPSALGAIVIADVLRRTGVAPADVGHVVMGHVINTEPRDMYLSRVAAIDAGVPMDVPAMNVNRLCGSGLQAVVSAAQAITLGDAEVAVAGGSESMSRSPHSTRSLRTGVRMGLPEFSDMLLGALTDPFGAGHMGITAENIARRWQITRNEQDDFALESQQRAARAIAEGRFASQIVSVAVKRGRETISFGEDEHVRGDTELAALGKLRPAFDKEGSVTAGNSSGINDGAAAVVLMSAARARAEGRTPRARIVGYAHAGVDPAVMGVGPVPAVRKLLEKTGLTVNDFDVIESNEAFAAQACHVSRELGFASDRTNPNGGAIALGHPVGATGVIMLVKAMYELERIKGRRALCTMCIGGGQGIAVAIEVVT